LLRHDQFDQSRDRDPSRANVFLELVNIHATFVADFPKSGSASFSGNGRLPSGTQHACRYSIREAASQARAASPSEGTAPLLTTRTWKVNTQASLAKPAPPGRKRIGNWGKPRPPFGKLAIPPSQRCGKRFPVEENGSWARKNRLGAGHGRARCGKMER
jgi:hypothetical protein